tara:strand:- start:2418 stop:2765 length:348 start_codon:yes stop_codon:yes gene_type:complete
LSARSAKAKGRRLQNFVRDMIRDAFPKLEADDIKSQTMGMTGQDIVLSPIAKKSIPYAIECKNVEKIRIWSAIDQAKKNIENNETPTIVFKRNGVEPWVAIPFDHWLDLIMENIE